MNITKKSSILKFIRATSMLVGFSIAINSYDADAKLPLNAFKGVTSSFNEKYKNFSPTIGMASLDSSIMYNLRFSGNFNYVNPDKPIDDVPLDSIALLTKELFPSNTGELGVGMTAPQWLANNMESPFIVAKFLNLVNTLRENHGTVDEQERLKLIEEIKANWELEYPKIVMGEENGTQFEKDMQAVLEKEPQNLIALKDALVKMASLTVEKIDKIFTKKNNKKNDLTIAIHNDIVDIRNSQGTKHQIDTILNNTEMESPQKISAIMDILQSKFDTDKYIQEELNKIPPANGDTVRADIKKDIESVKQLLERFLKSGKFTLSQNYDKAQKQISLNKDISNNDIKNVFSSDPMTNIFINDKTDPEKINEIVNYLNQLFLNNEDYVQSIVTLKSKSNIKDTLIESVKTEKNKAMADLSNNMIKAASLEIKDVLNVVKHLYGTTFLNIEPQFRIDIENIKKNTFQQAKNNNKNRTPKSTSKTSTSPTNTRLTNAQKIEEIMEFYETLKQKLESEPAEQVKRTSYYQQDRENARTDRRNKFFEDQPAPPKDGTKTRPSKSTLNKILDSITQSIQTELNNDPVYPKHTTEQIILAHFCAKFNSQEDLRQLLTMLSEMNPNIINPKNIHLGLMTEADLENPDALPQNFDTVYYIQNADKFAFNNPTPPYTNTSRLLENNSTHPFDRAQNKMADTTFHDCAEIALRHFTNLMLYNPETRKFDLSTIKNYVETNNPQNSYFENFVAFYENDENILIKPFLKKGETYKRQTSDRVENGSEATRSAWNMVVGDLNARAMDTNVPKIRYFNNDSYEYNLFPGFINFMRVCQKIFGLNFEHGDYDAKSSPEEKKKWLQQSFNVLFNALTVKKDESEEEKKNRKTFRADYSKINFKDSDFFGALPITVYQNNKILFSFILNQNETHAHVSELTKQATKPIPLLDINYGIDPSTAEETLWLLSATKMNDKIKDRAEHPFNKLFNKELKEFSQQIEFLTKVNEQYDPANPFFMAHAFKTMLKNTISRLNLEDPQALTRAAPILIKMSSTEGIKEAVLESFKNIRIGPEFDISKALGRDFNSEQSIEILKLVFSILEANNSSLTSLNLKEAHRQSARIISDRIPEVLKKNTTLTSLNLQDLGMYGSQLQKIAESLENNTTLMELNISNHPGNVIKNMIGPKEAIAIADALKKNKSLIKLNLTRTFSNFEERRSLNAEEIKPIFEALATNTSLESLNLANNSIDNEGAKVIADFLPYVHLKELDLSNNAVGTAGAAAILSANSSLKSLDMIKDSESRGIYRQIPNKNSEEDKKSWGTFVQALADNNTLTSLNLKNQYFDQQALEDIAKALQQNKTMTSLNLQRNSYGIDLISAMPALKEAWKPRDITKLILY